MKKTCLAISLALSVFAKAQDTTQFLNHEIGFNTVSLIKQIISNSPSATLSQLPYTLFYNFNASDLVGIRLGFGGNVSNVETTVEGQIAPRVSKSSNVSARVGITSNFVRHNRLTLNGFMDFIVVQGKLTSSNTSTVQQFPNPVTTQKVESTTSTSGSGLQVGVGVKYNLYKHLSLYMEVPLSYLVTQTKAKDSISSTADPFGTTTTNTTKNTDIKLTLPATLYLVLRF